MRPFPGFDRQKARGFVSVLCCGLLAASFALASPADAAGGGAVAAGEEAAGVAAEEPSTRPSPVRTSRRTSRFVSPARSGTRSVANASFGEATSCQTPR
jgi:hypothetical protein